MFLELSHLAKSFGDKTVVRDLSLGLEQGEVVCLLGSSGCGKTTTLRLVGGFLRPDAGSVLIDGRDATSLPPETRPTATVFQSYALFPHLSVRDNIAYGLRRRGVSRAERDVRVREMLEAVGLVEFAGMRPQDLSGGQRQRVALARSLVLGPKVLLLDEPFSNLDANLRLRMREEMRQIQRRLGVTMLFVTHDREEAMAFGDRIAVMYEGTICQVGSPCEVYEHPTSRYCAEFLGTVNELAIGGREVLFRPEDVRLGAEGGLVGTVEDATYLGGRWECRLKVSHDGGWVSVTALAPSDFGLTRGQSVPFEIARAFEVSR